MGSIFCTPVSNLETMGQGNSSLQPLHVIYKNFNNIRSGSPYAVSVEVLRSTTLTSTEVGFELGIHQISDLDCMQILVSYLNSPLGCHTN
ncbi:hypothetical protein TNCV_904771 [Trichonephila clavipes]|nr:hypothetical protein TNCV_904771 [Trichonephila clavipes]